MNIRPPTIPFSILRELRCRNCQNVVSCGPVYVIPDESVLCGRCKNFAKDIYRNTSFEALASMFLYPCQYWEDHCPRILRWDECFLHEEECSYNGGCGLFWRHPRAYLKGKREMPFGDLRLIPIPEKLLDNIKCFQCESYLSCDPVFIRSDGRNICHRCIHSNGTPKDCVRNTAYETLSNIIVFPCVFRNRGCPTRLKFGTDLWHHEADCSYNQMFKKYSDNGKKKGVIETHSGHVYGTITPNFMPFSRPASNNEFDINRQLLQSLKKQQERKMIRAEEIGSNITKYSSEDGSDRGSVRENQDEFNRYDELDSKPSSLQVPQTPLSGISDELSMKSPVFLNSPRDFLHFDFTSISNIKTVNDNYYQNTQVTQENDDGVIPPSDLNDENYVNIRRSTINGEPSMRPASILKSPLQELDYNPLNGQTPIYVNPYGQGLIPKPSVKGVVRTDSLSSNRELIHELQTRQSKMKTSEMKEGESPYKECNNLEEILQVHDTFSVKN